MLTLFNKFFFINIIMCIWNNSLFKISHHSKKDSPQKIEGFFPQTLSFISFPSASSLLRNAFKKEESWTSSKTSIKQNKNVLPSSIWNTYFKKKIQLTAASRFHPIIIMKRSFSMREERFYNCKCCMLWIGTLQGGFSLGCFLHETCWVHTIFTHTQNFRFCTF